MSIGLALLLLRQPYSLVPERTQYTVRAGKVSTFSIKLSLRNKSDQPISVPKGAFYSSHFWVLLDKQCKFADSGPHGLEHMREFQLSPKQQTERATVSPGRALSYSTPLLSESFALKPGRYTLHIKFAPAVAGCSMDVDAPPIRINVTQ